MKKVFEKYETLFCILLIVIYLILNSFCIQNFGAESIQTVVINSLISLGLVILIISLKRVKYYGLAKAVNTKEFLYFLPLLVLSSINLWGGINLNVPVPKILLHILLMINVGLIEEVIFRGFLFKMMEKSNVKVAILVNALTFGVGHIANLLNGAELIPTLLQILSATAIGYLFVIIFYKSKSIVPCILTHILINATSVLAVENVVLSYITCVASMIISIGYAIYINKCVKDKED